MMFKEMTNLTIQIIKQDIGPHANSYGPLRQTWQVDTVLLILIGGGILWWWWWWRQWREDFGFEWHMDGYSGTNEGWDKNAWIKAVGSNRGCKLPPQEGFTWWCFSRLIRQNLELPKLELNSSDHQGGIFSPSSAIQQVHKDGMEMTLDASKWRTCVRVSEKGRWGRMGVVFPRYLHVGEGAGQGAGTRPPLLLQSSAQHLKLPLLLPHRGQQGGRTRTLLHSHAESRAQDRTGQGQHQTEGEIQPTPGFN